MMPTVSRMTWILLALGTVGVVWLLTRKRAEAGATYYYVQAPSSSGSSTAPTAPVNPVPSRAPAPPIVVDAPAPRPSTFDPAEVVVFPAGRFGKWVAPNSSVANVMIDDFAEVPGYINDNYEPDPYSYQGDWQD